MMKYTIVVIILAVIMSLPFLADFLLSRGQIFLWKDIHEVSLISSEIASYLDMSAGLFYRMNGAIFEISSLSKKELSILENASISISKREQLHQYVNSDLRLSSFKNTSVCEVFENPDMGLNFSSDALKTRCTEITA
jgi:hypothetical protein